MSFERKHRTVIKWETKEEETPVMHQSQDTLLLTWSYYSDVMMTSRGSLLSEKDQIVLKKTIEFIKTVAYTGRMAN